MSKLNHLFSAEEILFYQMHQKWGYNVMKACPSIQWSLGKRISTAGVRCAVHFSRPLECSVRSKAVAPFCGGKH